ncbi:MAG: response regulator [Bacteroidetes bacterium]|jgi:CheY-like chemotaxis protein|nr:response regulator [Bacteroidota bacterium]MBT3749296.1 response regulator [Bacteroidota bacterium]MBT4398249.1 response regulator [Bacteroidota bacterium]MBT4409034.1 response regulator [Bacteroidota bacterium]MBT5427846.1 response regulator [Bacteroidota bacterium]
MDKTILLIDDDQDLIDAFQIAIESQGYNTESANNGSDGYLKIKSHNPDLVILDVMMDNDLEGYNLLHKIKEDQIYHNLPIIQLTGMVDQLGVNLRSAVEEQDELPNVYFENKPIDPLRLIELIKELLE